MLHTCQACANNVHMSTSPRISEITWKFLTEKELFQEWKLLKSSYYWPVIKTLRIWADGLVWWFSVLSVPHNHTESLLKCNCWAPPLQFLILSSQDPNFAIFSKFPEGCCCCWSGDHALGTYSALWGGKTQNGRNIVALNLLGEDRVRVRASLDSENLCWDSSSNTINYVNLANLLNFMYLSFLILKMGIIASSLLDCYEEETMYITGLEHRQTYSTYTPNGSSSKSSCVSLRWCLIRFTKNRPK